MYIENSNIDPSEVDSIEPEDLTKRGGIRKTSEERAVTNKQNAQHSTGPRSESGKARSSMNAVRLNSSSPVFYFEPGDHEAFDIHRRELYIAFRPVAPLEKQLVERMVLIDWQIKRSHATEISAPVFGALKRPEVAEDLTSTNLAQCEFIDQVDTGKTAKTTEILSRTRSRNERDYQRLRVEYKAMRHERLYPKNEPIVDDGFDPDKFDDGRVPFEDTFNQIETAGMDVEIVAFTPENTKNEPTGKPKKDKDPAPPLEKNGFVNDWTGFANKDRTWFRAPRQNREDRWGQKRWPYNPDGSPRPFWGGHDGKQEEEGPLPGSGMPMYIDPIPGWHPSPHRPKQSQTEGSETDQGCTIDENEPTGNLS